MSLLTYLDTVADGIGLSGQEFRFALCLLSCYPLAISHRFLPTTSGANLHKHAYSLILGLLQAYICFGTDLIHFVISTSVTYLIMLLFPKNSGWLAFLYNMAHLTWGNYDRMVSDYLGYSLNWTLPQMILCCKLCSVAWNYHDGQTAKEKNTSLKHKLDEFQTKQMLPELPHPIEFFGYAFFFCGFLTGPWSDYRDYVDFTSRKMFKAEGGKIPNSILFVLKRLVMIAIALVGFKLSDDYNVKWTLTPEWMTFPLWKRCLLHIVVVELFYCKYYVVWWLGEGACSVIGISYNGRDEKGRVKWDRIRMVDIVKFKFAKSITRDMVPNWNIMSQHWLNRYVHRRFVGLGLSRTTSRYTTFLVSALWHGLYPGYYLFFIQCAVFMSIADLLHEMAMPFFTKEDGTPKYPQQYLLNVLVPISTLACLDYLAITFQLMAFSYAIQSLTTTYWIGHIFMLGVLITYFVTKPFRKSQKKRDYKVINIDDQSISTTKSLADKKR